MYTRLCSSILFPLHERLKGHRSVALRRDLEVTQWWPAERIEELQLRKLRQFLATAARDVPYYSSVLGHPDDLATLPSVDGLRQLPFLTKDVIRQNTEQLMSRNAGKLIRYTTGGSSGSPLIFYMGRGRVDHDVAAKWRATRWWNVDIGDTEAVLWGSPIELGSQDRLRIARDRILRSHLFPAFQMSAEQMDGYLDRLERLRPRMLFGYASALALLARHARARQRDMRHLGIRVAFSTGETLYPDQRQDIEAQFGAPVANGYGSRDAGFIAHQCPAGSLHLSAEDIVVELLDPEGRPVAPGTAGEITVTHMATTDFPFIRYRTGDMAMQQAQPCSCGRGLPVLAEVQGRSTDFVHTPSGNTMHALALIYEVRDKPGIQAFKFVQQEDLSMDLFIVADASVGSDVELRIVAGLEQRLGEGSVVRLRRVPSIEAEKSGKYRYVISHARPTR